MTNSKPKIETQAAIAKSEFRFGARHFGALSAMSTQNELPPLFKSSKNKKDYNDGKNIGWGVIEYPDPVMKHGQN